MGEFLSDEVLKGLMVLTLCTASAIFFLATFHLATQKNSTSPHEDLNLDLLREWPISTTEIEAGVLPLDYGGVPV